MSTDSSSRLFPSDCGLYSHVAGVAWLAIIALPVDSPNETRVSHKN